MTAETAARTGPAAAALDAAGRLCASAEAAGWRGPDAYDGLWWPGWPRPLVAGRRRRQAIIQLHARSPLDVRRLYRREHPRLAKAVAIFGATRLRLHELTGADRDRACAAAALDVLDADRSSGTPAWGYPFDTQTRWSFYAADSPNVVVTAYAGHALQDGADRLGEARFARRALDAARWVQEELFVPDLGIYCYHRGSRSVIHNASLLGARFVRRLLPGDPAVAEAVSRAVERTLAAQSADGSWPYGEGPGLQFVDSFHTGYVLECLAALADLDPRVPEAVARGAEHYVRTFFGADGRTPLWPDRPYPLDAHAAGTGMSALSTLAREDRVDPALVARVTAWAAANLMDGDHAVYRRHRRHRTHVRYVRWADAHMALGFSEAARLLG